MTPVILHIQHQVRMLVQLILYILHYLRLQCSILILSSSLHPVVTSVLMFFRVAVTLLLPQYLLNLYLILQADNESKQVTKY